MAVTRKNKRGKKSITGELTEAQSTILAGIIAGVTNLFTKHAHEIDRIIEEAETPKLTVSFPVEIDRSESEPQLTVGVRFAETTTDRVSTTLPDPGQTQFEFVTPAEAKARRAQEKAEGGDGEPAEGENGDTGNN
jgi:hypothetical protein